MWQLPLFLLMTHPLLHSGSPVRMFPERFRRPSDFNISWILENISKQLFAYKSYTFKNTERHNTNNSFQDILIRKTTISVDWESNTFLRIFMFCARQRPLLAIVIITAAKEEVIQQVCIGRRSGTDDWVKLAQNFNRTDRSSHPV